MSIASITNAQMNKRLLKTNILLAWQSYDLDIQNRTTYSVQIHVVFLNTNKWRNISTCIFIDKVYFYESLLARFKAYLSNTPTSLVFKGTLHVCAISKLMQWMEQQSSNSCTLFFFNNTFNWRWFSTIREKMGQKRKVLTLQQMLPLISEHRFLWCQ